MAFILADIVYNANSYFQLFSHAAIKCYCNVSKTIGTYTYYTLCNNDNEQSSIFLVYRSYMLYWNFLKLYYD